MGCKCKKTEGLPDGEVLEGKEGLVATIVKYLVKIIGFLFGIVLLPLIMLVIIWFMFDTIVLNKDIDLRRVIDRFVKVNQFFTKHDEEEEEEEEDLSEEDVYMVNVEEITNKSK